MPSFSQGQAVLLLPWYSSGSNMQTQCGPRAHSQPCDFSLGLAHLPWHPQVTQFQPLLAAVAFYMPFRKAFPFLIDEIFISSFHSSLCAYMFICCCHLCVWTGMEEDFAYIPSVILNWMNCHSLLRPRFIFCFSWSRVKLLTKQLIELMNTTYEVPKYSGNELLRVLKGKSWRVPRSRCLWVSFICLLFFLESETLYDVVRKTEGKRGLDSRSGLNYT